jgi:hypothetical protein
VRLLNYTSLGVGFENLVYVAPIRQNGRNALYFGAHAAMPLWEDPKALDGKSKKGSSGKDKDKKKSSKKKSSAASDTDLLEEAPPTPSKAAKVKIASVSSATSNISDLSGGGAGASTRSRSSSSGGERLISVASSSISAIASEQLFPLASRCRMRSQTTDQNKPFGESYRANTAPMFFMSTYLRGQLLIKTHTADASASMAAAAAAGVVESFAASATNTELQLQFELVRDVIGDRDDECFIGLELHEPLANDWAAHWVNKTLIATAREYRASNGGSSAASDSGDKSASAAAASAASAPTVSAHFSAGRYRSKTLSSATSSSSAMASPSAKSPTATKMLASADQAAFEYPHIVYPFGAMFDRVVVTDVESGGAEARQVMPALTLGDMTVPKSEFNQVYAGGDEELATLRPRPGFVYTMTVATGLFDLETCASMLDCLLSYALCVFSCFLCACSHNLRAVLPRVSCIFVLLHSCAYKRMQGACWARPAASVSASARFSARPPPAASTSCATRCCRRARATRPRARSARANTVCASAPCCLTLT